MNICIVKQGLVLKNPNTSKCLEITKNYVKARCPRQLSNAWIL